MNKKRRKWVLLDRRSLEPGVIHVIGREPHAAPHPPGWYEAYIESALDFDFHRRFLLLGHTPDCWKWQTKRWLHDLKYTLRWPHYCRKCGGTGGHSYPSTYDDPGGFDECPKCWGEGICPRCGKGMTEDNDYEACLSCGWSQEAEGRYGSDMCECFEYRPLQWQERRFKWLN